jgi:hypothetical protein
MTSSASSATWLPTALGRVRTPAPPVRTGGRHLAPEVADMVRIAAPEDLTRAGRHTEPQWTRELHDPRRDEVDAFDWLGFSEG